MGLTGRRREKGGEREGQGGDFLFVPGPLVLFGVL